MIQIWCLFDVESGHTALPLFCGLLLPIGSMYGIYANIGGILMVNVTIYSIHGSYGLLDSHLWIGLGYFGGCFVELQPGRPAWRPLGPVHSVILGPCPQFLPVPKGGSRFQSLPINGKLTELTPRTQIYFQVSISVHHCFSTSPPSTV